MNEDFDEFKRTPFKDLNKNLEAWELRIELQRFHVRLDHLHRKTDAILKYIELLEFEKSEKTCLKNQ